ncbi:phage major capsid protein [Faecalicatena fissicatena]|uniref:phage major capsid protein n=1 Tax=Faecalicatena fissicatena TaxID=290055 RepID=UPI00156E5E69|nr:phage major capsid protein [Faecalicatena fissicatena]
MGRKKVLEKRLARLQAKKTKLTERALASQDAAEVRSINEELGELNEEIAETQEEIDTIEEVTPDPEPDPNQQRSNPPVGAQQVNNGIPMASYSQNPAGTQQRENKDPYASMEYREAFKAYVQRGTPIPENLTQRAGGDAGPTVAADLGMIIPTTIMNEFIKKVSKVYGQLYSKVRKLNIQGGVKFPISDLKANFKWITETTPSGRQKAGDVKEYVEFSYNIGEIRVSQTLLSQVVALQMFEDEIVRIMTEAYVEAMDKGIIAGTGAGQMLGILKDTRVTEQTGHIIEFTAEQFGNWEQWRKRLFSVIPLSKRGKGEFIFTASTVESNLLTMKDANNRPIYKEAAELNVGESATDGRFYGREVTMVEPDIVADFDTAGSGDVVGVYWIPDDYAINTNLAFGMKRYFDEDKNEWVNKGLTIVDGKILDPSGVYIIKKK